MNEKLFLYLNIDADKHTENMRLFMGIDALLNTVGMKYSGTFNMYFPVEERNRDHAVYAACELLENTAWLKGIYEFACIGNSVNACPMEKILTDHMTEPSAEKMQYYEEYYQRTGKLAHAVVVDEQGRLRDGYISYLLALKYGIRPTVYEAFFGQPLRKVIIGQHVEFIGDKWRICAEKRFQWIYGLKHAVVPGDILQVRTKRGLAFVCVENLEYVTGEEFCNRDKYVKQHMDMHIG